MRFWGDGNKAGASIVREDKGKSLLEFPSDYVVLDIETTGLDPWENYVIELAAVRVRNREIVDTYEQLVNPMTRITPEITDITGITHEMLLDEPTFEDVSKGFKEFLGADLLVGHNVGFDIAFLYEKYFELTDQGITNDYIDTVRWSRQLLPELEQHRLSDVCERLNIKNPGAHRALNDVLTTQRAYEALRQLHLEESDEDDSEQISLF